MKKGFIVVITLLLAFIIGVVSHSFVCGGKPEIENFDSISDDFEIIAKASMKYYNESSDKDKRITIGIYDDCMSVYNRDDLGYDTKINLNEEEKTALKTVDSVFSSGALWVTEDYIIFWEDETKYYGLVYSEKPLSAILNMESDWDRDIEYHRINKNWYEIGAFGR